MQRSFLDFLHARLFLVTLRFDTINTSSVSRYASGWRGLRVDGGVALWS